MKNSSKGRPKANPLRNRLWQNSPLQSASGRHFEHAQGQRRVHYDRRTEGRLLHRQEDCRKSFEGTQEIHRHRSRRSRHGQKRGRNESARCVETVQRQLRDQERRSAKCLFRKAAPGLQAIVHQEPVPQFRAVCGLRSQHFRLPHRGRSSQAQRKVGHLPERRRKPDQGNHQRLSRQRFLHRRESGRHVKGYRIHQRHQGLGKETEQRALFQRGYGARVPIQVQRKRPLCRFPRPHSRSVRYRRSALHQRFRFRHQTVRRPQSDADVSLPEKRHQQQGAYAGGILLRMGKQEQSQRKHLRHLSRKRFPRKMELRQHKHLGNRRGLFPASRLHTHLARARIRLCRSHHRQGPALRKRQSHHRSVKTCKIRQESRRHQQQSSACHSGQNHPQHIQNPPDPRSEGLLYLLRGQSLIRLSRPMDPRRQTLRRRRAFLTPFLQIMLWISRHIYLQHCLLINITSFSFYSFNCATFIDFLSSICLYLLAIRTTQ